MVRSSGGDFVWLGPVGASRYEDVKGMHRVGRASQERCEVDVNGRRPLWLRAEARMSAIPQFGG